MGQVFLGGVEAIRFGGPQGHDPLSVRFYDPHRVVAGKTMREQLPFAVCWWHSFNFGGTDIFGGPTLDRPWLLPGLDPMQQAQDKELEAKAVLAGERSLDAILARVRAESIDPKTRSGRQEYLENLFSRYL